MGRDRTPAVYILASQKQWKINLIEATNPDWRDLALDYGFEPLSRRRSLRHGC